MNLADYAQHVIAYLQDNGFEYADQDPRGAAFPGGILTDLGGGQKVAFLMPTYDLAEALSNLNGHLETIYPQGHTPINASMATRDSGVIRVHVRLNEAALAPTG